MTPASGSPPEGNPQEPPTPPEVSQDRVARRLPGSPPPWRVFLSHTSEFRRFPSSGGSYIDKAERAVSAANHQVGNMEHYRANDGDTGRFDELQVQTSQVYVGIYGMRWGTPVPGQSELSYTVQEFEAASAAGIPRLIFVVDEHDDSGDVRLPPSSLRDDEHGHRQQTFLRRIHASGELIIKRFRGPDHLAGLVESSLRELEKQVLLTVGGMNQAPRLPPRRHYGPADLEAWVSRHHTRLEKAFLGLPPVQARQVHVPLDVCLTPAGAAATEGPRLLTPEDLSRLMEEGGNHVLLLSGDGGAGKTSLAFAIARWWLESKPGGVVRLPVLIETALAPGETVVERVRAWLRGQLAWMAGASAIDPPPELVEALLAAKRLVPIIDHLSELAPAAREQLLAALPPGLVVVTSRSDDDGFRERPLSRIEPQRIAVERLQAFFLDYLRRKGQGEALSDDDLMPAQAQLKRIVGDKPITVLLAQMFIDDVIANREEGFLAGSVPDLMLRYVQRLDGSADPALRKQKGLEISENVVQRALRVVALASHLQGPSGQPLFQPLEFSEALTCAALMAEKPAGLGLGREQSEALLGYLIKLRLLLQPGVAAGRLRFPLDPLADHLAAAEQFERLEEQALLEGAGVWEAFVASLEPRPHAERERMRGFLLALRDGAMEAQSKGQRALAMPEDVPDRLAKLGFLDPEGERYRLALQRARKWMWELGVPVASERRDAIGKLAAMAAAQEDSERRAAGDVASRRLARVLAEVVPERQAERREEQKEAAVVLGLIGSKSEVDSLKNLARDGERPVELRKAALESLGLSAKNFRGEACHLRDHVEAFLEEQLRADALDLLVDGDEGWAEHDRRLPLLQGASRGLQLAASVDLPLLGSGVIRRVPMLTLTAIKEGKGLRIRTEVVNPAVWKLPLPQCPGVYPQQIDLIVVPGGEYKIGSPDEEDGRNVYTQIRQKCEGVNVEAERTISLKPFALVRHPITQAQWHSVAGLPMLEHELNPIPSSFKPDNLWERHAQPGGLPVDSVSWFYCQEWLKRLNLWLQEKWLELGGLGAAPVFGLPSESQWEVACRAGSNSPFHFGDTLDASWANYDGSYIYGPSRYGAYRQRPMSSGFFGLVNRWGLAEMHGQLLEWCGDRWHCSPLQSRVATKRSGFGYGKDQEMKLDGKIQNGPDPALNRSQEQLYRLLRGGSWIDAPFIARAAMRNSQHPGTLVMGAGFRPGCFSLPGLLLGA